MSILLGMAIVIMYNWLSKRIMNRLKEKFQSRWYQVKSFSRIPSSDGSYQMDFYIDNEHEGFYRGYTKKLPPKDTRVEDLKVKIRKYHNGRNAFRVFWEINPPEEPFY